MGKNKLQKFAEMETYSNVFQYPFARLQAEGGFSCKGRWSEFFGNGNPIVLELGCGKGEYTVGLARLFPDKNFIGIDIKGARMWTGAKESNIEGLKNVAFLRTDIELITEFFAENEVSEIWITFPDPQMKKVRKRLTSTRFMALYQQIMKPQGIVHLKTDSPFLYAYTTLMVKYNGYRTLMSTDNLYASGYDDEILKIRTYYESQWIERGMNIKYIKFELSRRDEFTEPQEEIPEDDYRSFNRRSNSLTNKKGE